MHSFPMGHHVVQLQQSSTLLAWLPELFGRRTPCRATAVINANTTNDTTHRCTMLSSHAQPLPAFNRARLAVFCTDNAELNIKPWSSSKY